jgi:hypothetical protein
MNFEIKYCKKSNKPVFIESKYPSQESGLQVVDYLLWAVQRMYERQEDRFYDLMEDKYKLIMDLDDKRNKQYGEWYTDQNRLSLDKIKPVEG